MARIEDTFEFAVSPDVIMRAVRKIAVDFGWRVMLDEAYKITIKENHLTIHNYNAVLAVSVIPSASGSSVRIDGSIYGASWGPQPKHLKGQMGWFVNALQLAVDTPDVSEVEPTQPGSHNSIVDELNKLSELHAQGVLNDEEFAAAKAKILG